MALGNLGRVYQHYVMLEYDDSHHDLFHYFAYHYLIRAIKYNDPNTYDVAKNVSKQQLTSMILSMSKYTYFRVIIQSICVR